MVPLAASSSCNELCVAASVGYDDTRGGAESKPPDLVGQRIIGGHRLEKAIQKLHVATDRGTASWEAGVRRENETGVRAPLRRPQPRDHDEVADIVRHERAALVVATREKGIVGFHLPAPLNHGVDVVALLSKPSGDPGRVVVIEGQPHASARC